MENNRKTSANNYNLGRERFSNFVVDLRDAGKKVVDFEKTVEKEIARDLMIVKKKVKIIKESAPNLLASERARGHFFDCHFFDLRNIYSRVRTQFRNLFLNVRLLKRGRSSRVNELKVREAAFRSSLRLKISRFKNDDSATLRLGAKGGASSSAAWYRPVLYFSFILVIIILPFKILASLDVLDFKNLEKRIISRSESAVSSLMAAADAVSRMELKDADSNFQTAYLNFLEAQNDLNKINDSILALAAFSGDEKMKLAAESKKFLAAGASASSLGRNLVLATDSLFSGDKNKFGVSLDNFLAYGNLAVSDAKSLKKTIAKINSANLPEAYRAKFTSLSQQAGLLSDNLENFVSVAAKLKELLGLSRDKRYLLVFQNNAELRASGGFIGSYALVDISDGRISNLEVPGGGSYDTEGGMKTAIVAPEPLWLVNPLWHFWDANWWPDWPTTAKNLAWFYEKSGGPSVDGVVGVTPTVMERLLEIVGPIDLTAEYGLIIDSNNFWEIVQKITEQDNLVKTHPEFVAGLPATSTIVRSALPLEQDLENNSDNKPKKIIGDLLAKILEILPQKLNKENLAKIITVFEESMSEKQILFYFNDSTLQSEFISRNWAGELRSTDKDYLMVVNTNIAGQKSDRLMHEKIDLVSEAAANGDLINTVTIMRAHNGVKNEALTGVRNVDWLRIYVPAGSELLDASGFVSPDAKYLKQKPEASLINLSLLEEERTAKTDIATGVKIYTENNKTVFANWLMVDPGQTVTVVLKYRLPFNILNAEIVGDSVAKRFSDWLNDGAPKLSPYSLLVQKQPGSVPSEFTSRLILPENIDIFWRSSEDWDGQAGWEISEPLDSDKFYSLLLKK